LNPESVSEKHRGLTAIEALEKLKKEGHNTLPSSKSKNFLAIAFGVVKEPMFILLVGCGTLYVVMGDLQEGLMLLGFVFIIMGIEFFQEKKTGTDLKKSLNPVAMIFHLFFQEP